MFGTRIVRRYYTAAVTLKEIDDYVAEVMQSEMMRQAVPGNFGGSMASEAKSEL